MFFSASPGLRQLHSNNSYFLKEFSRTSKKRSLDEQGWMLIYIMKYIEYLLDQKHS